MARAKWGWPTVAGLFMIPVVNAATQPYLIAEEEDFLVVDKPAHLLSHPTRPDGQPSLISWLQVERPGDYLALVHRLDRETSGLMLIAKNPAATSALGRLIERRVVEKEYEALCWGGMGPEAVQIDAALGELGISPENRVKIRQGVRPLSEGGAEASTRVERLFSGNGFTHVRAVPRTGRLHQIRVHLSLIGLPVVGDKIYGPDAAWFLRFIETGWTMEMERALLLSRHALHAATLRFWWGGRMREFHAPLPRELEVFLRTRVRGEAVVC